MEPRATILYINVSFCTWYHRFDQMALLLRKAGSSTGVKIQNSGSNSTDWNPDGLIPFFNPPPPPPPPSFDRNIHIHDDLIIGKTALVKTKDIISRQPLGDLGDRTDDNSTLFQVMAWCPPTTNHYVIQRCPRSVLPHGITGPQWVNKYIVMSRSD